MLFPAERAGAALAVSRREGVTMADRAGRHAARHGWGLPHLGMSAAGAVSRDPLRDLSRLTLDTAPDMPSGVWFPDDPYQVTCGLPAEAGTSDEPRD
jgi:hypothetical protein